MIVCLHLFSDNHFSLKSAYSLILQMTIKVLLLSLLFTCVMVNAGAQEKKDSLTPQKIDSLTPRQVDTLIKKTDTVIITKEAQNITPVSSFGRAYASSYWTDTKSLTKNPLHWKTGQIITAAAVIAATAGLISLGR